MNPHYFLTKRNNEKGPLRARGPMGRRPKRGITISPFGPLRQRLRGEQRGNKGDFVNCRCSINTNALIKLSYSLARYAL